MRWGFTTRASCLLAAGATALLCGLLLGEADLVRAGVLGAAVPLAAAIVVHRSRVQIANRRAVEPKRAASGEAVVIHLTITNRSRLRTGALMLEDRMPERLEGRARFVLDGLASRESRTVTYRMPGLPRGRYQAGPLRIRLTDPFRLVDVLRSFTATSSFLITPIVDPLPAIEPPRSHDIGDNAGSHSIGSRGADDASTREYRTGDDLRKIHWRSSARTGALMVRQEERPWQGMATVLLDLREQAHVSARTGVYGRHDDRQRSSLEWAISAAASVGTHLMIAGREVGVISELSEPRRLRPGSPGELSEYLAGVRAVRGDDLVPATAVLNAAARDSALTAVLGELDPASLRVLTEAHPRGSAVPAVALLLDTATWAGNPPCGPDGAPQTAARVLRAAGWRVAVVHHGDTTAAAWQTALRSGSRGSLGRMAIR